MSAAKVPQDRTELSAWLKDRVRPVAVRGSSSRGNEDEIMMSGLNRLVLYEPGEMIVQVEAGMTLAELDRTLAEHHQWIPTLQPDEDESTTIGGALSMDRYQPRTRLYSPLRTAVLGGTYCTTSGDLFRSGSRVVKSVAGYDTHRAFVGAEGRFGVIVEVTLRVLPRPERFSRFITRKDLYAAVLRETPSVLERITGGLLAELSGYAEDVEESLARLSDEKLRMVGDTEWSKLLLDLRRSYQKRDAEPAANDLLRSVQGALDPKGVFRERE